MAQRALAKWIVAVGRLLLEFILDAIEASEAAFDLEEEEEDQVNEDAWQVGLPYSAFGRA